MGIYWGSPGSLVLEFFIDVFIYPYLGGGRDSVGQRGGASEAPPKKSIMEWAKAQYCYRHIVKV